MNRQAAFDLNPAEARGIDDFHITPANGAAVAALSDWAGWPQGRMVLAGPPGSGRTHLAHAWAAAARGRVEPAAALSAARVPLLAGAPIALDDAQGLAGQTAGEAALLHLLNLARAEGAPVLLTGPAPAAAWGVRLPDLASRLAAAPLARLGPPDDALLAAVLVKHFADRQLRVAPAVVAYLVPRMHRSLAAARRLAAAIDARALAERRDATVPLVREVLAGLAEAGAEGA